MPCILSCGKTEKAMGPDDEYCCGTCTAKIMNLNNEGRRHLVDQFYLEGNNSAAEFLEAMFFGEHRPKASSKLKRRI